MNRDNIDAIVYHKNCLDGTTSAAAAYKYNKNFKFYGADAGKIPEDVLSIKNSNICFVDVSPNENEVILLKNNNNNLLIIDHHKTAIDRLINNTLIEKIFDVNHSAAYLTWRYFFPKTEQIEVKTEATNEQIEVKTESTVTKTETESTEAKLESTVTKTESIDEHMENEIIKYFKKLYKNNQHNQKLKRIALAVATSNSYTEFTRQIEIIKNTKTASAFVPVQKETPVTPKKENNIIDIDAEPQILDFINLVQDYDLNTKLYTDSNALHAGFNFYYSSKQKESDSDKVRKMVTLLENKELLLKYGNSVIYSVEHKALVEGILSRKLKRKYGKYTCYIVEVDDYKIWSEIGNKLCEDKTIDFSAVYKTLPPPEGTTYKSPNDIEHQVSLRSSQIRNTDVADIAKQYGGGGHRNAAGFTIKGKNPDKLFAKIT